jgi:hypothetical protein
MCRISAISSRASDDSRFAGFASSQSPAPVDTFDDVPDEPGHRLLEDVVGILDRYVAWPAIRPASCHLCRYRNATGGRIT